MIEFGRILIVDDSAMMRAVVRKTLQMTKVFPKEVVEANDGVEALAQLREKPFDIMFCDLNMPEMNGDELIASLPGLDLPSIPPIVVVSSEATTERIERLKSEHIIGVLRKPFTPEKMLQLIGDAQAVCDQGGGVMIKMDRQCIAEVATSVLESTVFANCEVVQSFPNYEVAGLCHGCHQLCR